MRYAKVILCAFTILVACAPARRIVSQTPAPKPRIVIAASVVLDGRGRVLPAPSPPHGVMILPADDIQVFHFFVKPR